MFRLALLLFVFISVTLAGMGMMVALVTGHDTAQPLMIAAAIGFLLSFPVSYIAAKRLS
ncbi:MAG: CTP synthetase [Rhodobacteraceae bacterium CG2_30_10_405]|nr:CTP synthetase [Rhodobacterales bacterium]NCO16651.1 CTP synthetase [Alphaproteobacteria bacterium]OIQ06644.1 MAG: CTP synthetase [Rhodobacteraceae bacterium CG2_30_10_405]